jgi:hypothetical protein
MGVEEELACWGETMGWKRVERGTLVHCLADRA